MSHVRGSNGFYYKMAMLFSIGLMAGACSIDIHASDSHRARTHADSEFTYYGGSERDLVGFNKIRIGGAFDVQVLPGAFKVEVDSDGPLEDIETYVEDQTLVVKAKNRRGHRGHDDKLIVHMPELTSFQAGGAIDGRIEDVAGKELEVSIAGAGDLMLKGDCSHLVVKIAGAGDVNAKNLACKSVEVKISGAGDAQVFASQSIDARVAGVGDISVYGNPPQVKRRVAGVGSVTIKK